MISKVAPTSAQRSELMSRVRQSGTSIELIVRKTLRELSIRYEPNQVGLAGRPDVVNRKQKRAVFINGCFWHGHTGCWHGRLPKSNTAFWAHKIAENRRRDRRKRSQLRREGYQVLILWECQLGDKSWLSSRLDRFFKPDRSADQSGRERLSPLEDRNIKEGNMDC
jgi:DNA mismatch endonuclease (patch repair protein)